MDTFKCRPGGVTYVTAVRVFYSIDAALLKK